MLTSQILRSRTQIALSLLQRSIHLQTQTTALSSSHSRCFATTTPEELEKPTNRIVIPSPPPLVEEAARPILPLPSAPLDEDLYSFVNSARRADAREEAQRLRLRRLIFGNSPSGLTVPTQGAPIRRVHAELRDPITIERAVLGVLRAGEETSYRNLTLERILAICRDPNTELKQNMIIRKVKMEFQRIGEVRQSIHRVGDYNIKEELEWLAAATPESKISPIMAQLGVKDVESDLGRYTIVNPHVSELEIGIEKPTDEMLARPVESFFPRRIEENIRHFKKAGRAPYVLVEIKGGDIQPYHWINAAQIIANQIAALITALDRNYIQSLPEVEGVWSKALYRRILAGMKRSSDYVESILTTSPEDPVLINPPEGGSEILSHYDAIILYLEESSEAMRKIKRLLEKEGMGENKISAAETDHGDGGLVEKRLLNNMEALRMAGPELDSFVYLDTYLGGRPVRRGEALGVAFLQVTSSITHIRRQIGDILGKEIRPPLNISMKRRRRKSATVPAEPALVVPNIRKVLASNGLGPGQVRSYVPGGTRGYATVSFRGLQMNSKGKGEKKGFGLGTPLALKPIVVKEGSIRHKMELMEKKRLEALQGLSYSLMAPDQAGITGNNAAMVSDRDDDGGISSWEGTGEIGGLNDESGLTPLKKGDLCELRRGLTPQIAIFLRPSPHGQPTADFLLESGELAMYNAARVVFSIPSFISEERTAEIITNIDHMFETTDLPRERRNELVLARSSISDALKKMRNFSNKAKAVFANEKPKISALYNRMALPDADSELTLFEAVEEIFGESYGNEELYTTHLALMGDGVRYLTDKGAHRATSTFRLRGKKEVEMIEFVTEQVRLGTSVAPKGTAQGKKSKKEVSALESFARKARILIDISRKNAKLDLENKQTVTRVPVNEVVWDGNDMKFIDYIKAGVLQYGSQSVPMDGLVPVVLRAIDRYEGELDNITAYQFVTDIGAWNKWEDLSLRQKNIAFPGMGVSGQADEDQKRFEDVNRPKGFEELKLVDSLKHIRKDWGNMEVYAIDDISAHEIDDGISLERVDDNINWVHVHIANPTAWLPPNHWLSDLAFRRRQSLYLPNQVLPMLPTALTERVGLASNRGVMTMSAKVNMDGELLEYNVQPGYVRNVKRFTYDAVSAALGYKKPEATTFTVGSFPEIRRKKPEIPNEKQIADLTILNKIALGFRKLRVKNDLIMVRTPNVDVDVYTGLDPFTHPTGNIPHLYRGHPAMKIRIETSDNREDGSHFIVSEMMQLANSVTAKFCGKHKIAAPFRVMEYDYERADLVDSYKNVILPSRNYLGIVSPELGIQYMMLIGKTRISASPSPHRLMGLDDGYIRASSPLRRYSDMITHWQIQAFLHGREPRTHKQINPFALELERGERLAAFTMKESKRFWASATIKRMMELKDPALPKQMTFMVMEKVPHPSLSTGLVWELGMAGRVAYDNATQELAVKPGDTLAVEPLAAVPGEKMVWFKYKGIIKKRSLDDVFSSD